MNTWRNTLVATGSALLKTVVNLLNHSKKNTSQCDSINEVLFYGDEDEEKKEQIGLNNLFCIYYVIVHACKSIDLCLPNLNSDTILNGLITVKHKNGAIIRVAIHDKDDEETLQKLTKQGIDVKVINSTVKLEHEFVLVDAHDKCMDAVAVIGSIDFETSRVNCNRDTTILTSELTVVTALKREFDRIWNFNTKILADRENDENNKMNNFNIQ